MTWEFRLNNGQNGVKEITDPLIDTEEIAHQRANAEFLAGGYLKRKLSLKTHRTDLKIGDIIIVNGLAYRILSVAVRYNGISLVSEINGVRYD